MPKGIPDGRDWAAAQSLLKKYPTKYGSLSWIASRPLIASINDILSRVTGDLVGDLRRDWVRRTPSPPGRLITRPTSSWMVIGDPGEQDGSQYVVCRALSEMSQALPKDEDGADPGFLLIMSDVIYPAGDVDDYRAAVYRPYRLATVGGENSASLKPDFTVSQPIYALPGNHDWYDGLSGFMYHFAGQDPPEPEVYTPAGRNPVHRLFRILWRRPRAAGAEAQRDREAGRLSDPGPEQPGPYYAIQTNHVLLVCIDTGIDGTVDADQYRWLRDVSRRPGAKLLVTGKPLVVDGQLHRTEVTEVPGWSVWDLVNDPKCKYVATMGGDIHNFQLYPRPDGGDGPVAHIVAGGGGAYMHATHVHHMTKNNQKIKPDIELYDEPPTMTFPNTAQSLRFFAYRLISGVSRAMVNLFLYFVALALAVVLARFVPVADPWVIPVSTGLSLLLVAAVRRAQHRGDQRTDDRPRRIVTWLGAPGVGLLTGGLVHRLDPENVCLYLLTATGLVLFLSLTAVIARQSRWWVGIGETIDKPHPWSGLGLALVCALAARGQIWLDLDHSYLWALPAAGVLLIGRVGASVRRRMSTWQRVSTPVTLIAQILFSLIVVRQVADRVRRRGDFYSAIFGGLVGLAAVIVATAVVVVLWTEVRAVWLRWSGVDRRSAWGRAAATISHRPIRVLLFMLGAWVAVTPMLSPTSRFVRMLIDRPAAGLSSVLVLVVAILFAVDFLHRRWPGTYRWVVIPAAIALSVAVLIFWPQWWWIRVFVAALVIIFGLLVGATMVHFSFLGAYQLALPRYNRIIRAGKRGERALEKLLPDEKIREVFIAREKRDLKVDEDNKAVLFWIRMVAPGISEPGGLMQRLVSELFSTDVPRFYKSFLSFTSQIEGRKVKLTVTLHKIYGDVQSEPVKVCELFWPAQLTVNWSVSGDLTFDPLA